MNALNFNKDRNIILFFGMFLILIINLLLDISLFISKIISVYIFGNLYMVTYLFFSFVLIILFLEVTFLRRNYFTITNFKKITFTIFILYSISYIFPYLEGNFILPYVAENYNEKDTFFFHMSFRYPKVTFTIHNLLLIIFSIIKISKKSGNVL